MLNMENAEEVMQILERFTRLKQKEIPKELDDYMNYVAKTGDTVFKWSSLKYLFREKLLNVIKNFHDTSPRVDDLPQYPNVDPFNYESMKSSLLERLDLFNAAPFTVQRLCELLTEPRKQYSRIDKFMRALEKNILVSTMEPGRKRTESENGDSLDSVVNNGEVSLDVNVDIDMENEPKIFMADTPNATSSSTPTLQPSSNLIHKADDDILPNPKKPKLDLATNDPETEAATKSITNNKTDLSEASAEKSDDIVDKKKNEGSITEGTIALDEKLPTADTAKRDNKDSECEKMEEESAATLANDNNNVDNKIKETKKKTEEKENSIVETAEPVEVEKVTPTTVTPNNSALVQALENIEKTENIHDVPQETKKDCNEEIVEKQEPSKEVETAKKIKENDDDKENQIGEIKEKTETNTTTHSEKKNDKKSESAPGEIVSPSSEENVEEMIPGKTEKIVPTAAEIVVVEDSKTKVVETSKTEEIPQALTQVIEKTVEKVEIVAVAEVVTPAVLIEEIKEKKSDIATEEVQKVDAVSDKHSIEIVSIQKAPPETLKEIQPTEVKEEQLEKIAEQSAATTNESKDVVASVAVEEQVVVADQPMEENLESIAEAEPVVSSVVEEPETATTIDEVTMGDSVEMATDAIELTKDEPSGMEVDDTSQEAMDQ